MLEFIRQGPGIKGNVFTVNSHVHGEASYRRQILEGSGIEKKINVFLVFFFSLIQAITICSVEFPILCSRYFFLINLIYITVYINTFLLNS